MRDCADEMNHIFLLFFKTTSVTRGDNVGASSIGAIFITMRQELWSLLRHYETVIEFSIRVMTAHYRRISYFLPSSVEKIKSESLYKAMFFNILSTFHVGDCLYIIENVRLFH